MVKTFLALSFLAVSCAAVPKPIPEIESCSDLIRLVDVIDGDSAGLFIAELGACAGRPVVVEINSPGGSVYAALEIQKAIERHGAPVVCVVDGMAASAAFVTLQSCHIRAMSPRSVLMAHHASLSGVSGQSQEMQNAADLLRAIDEAMIRHCAKRMGMGLPEFEAHVSGGREWWLALDASKVYNAIDLEMEVGEALELIRNRKP